MPDLDLDAIRAHHKAFEDAWDHEFCSPQGPAAAAKSAEDVPALLAALERLSVAKYVIAPEGCVGDRDCDEYRTADGAMTGIEWCSHVVHAVATADDAVRLDRVRLWLRDVDPEAADVDDLRNAVEMAKRAAFDELND